MSTVNSFFRTLLLSIATIALLGACSDDDDENGGPASPLPEIAQVRVAHLSPDVNEVDVWVDGTLQLEDVAFKGFSPYLELSAGTHQIQVYLANTTSNPAIDESVGPWKSPAAGFTPRLRPACSTTAAWA
jgi:hypothetical protein